MSGKGDTMYLSGRHGRDSWSNFLKALKSMMKQAVVFQNLVNYTNEECQPVLDEATAVNED